MCIFFKCFLQAEMKKATSLLLQHMLDRIKNLEDELHYVIVNSTNQFAKMSEQIAYLNTTIGSRFNESGLYCILLFCIVLYCIVLYCIVLHLP